MGKQQTSKQGCTDAKHFSAASDHLRSSQKTSENILLHTNLECMKNDQ